jgi:hypothetical protein
MQALRQKGLNDVVNACPFGCDDKSLDECGYCGHLVGFTNGGTLYEPRVRQANGRVITTGARKQKLQRGDILVQITTSARVYRSKPEPSLVVERHPDLDEYLALEEREAEIMAQAEALRSPVLEGEWIGPTAYGDFQEEQQPQAHEEEEASVSTKQKAVIRARKRSQSEATSTEE